MQSEIENATLSDDGESVGEPPAFTEEDDGVNFKLDEYKNVHKICIAGNRKYESSAEVIDKRKRDRQKKENEKNDFVRDKNIKESHEQRAKINMRERKRMHDLNEAMESLREVMPCANGPSMRKLSKIATLTLARNYIQMLTRSVEELKLMLDDVYRAQGGGPVMRRRHVVNAHPYAQYFGLSNNYTSYYQTGVRQRANIYNSNSASENRCAGFRCCNGPSIPQNRLQQSVCMPWNNSM